MAEIEGGGGGGKHKGGKKRGKKTFYQGRFYPDGRFGFLVNYLLHVNH